jgi:hypothetical protein
MEFLRKHPEIFMPRVEPHFFATDLYSPQFIRDESAYLSLFAHAKPGQRVGEKSARYITSRKASEKIKTYQPSADIIIMLRNPLEVMYSSHSRRVYYGTEDLLDFEVALDAEEDRRRGLRIPPRVCDRENWLLFYRETVRYTQQVRRFLESFGRERVHIIIFDDFIRDTAAVYRDTLLFLRVAPDIQSDFRQVNPNYHMRSKAVQDFLNHPPPHLRALVRLATPEPLRQLLIRGFRRLNSRREPRSPMEPELKGRLQAEFLPEVEQLSELLGRDLTHWCLD